VRSALHHTSNKDTMHLIGFQTLVPLIVGSRKFRSWLGRHRGCHTGTTEVLPKGYVGPESAVLARAAVLRRLQVQQAELHVPLDVSPVHCQLFGSA
jgi:hypothetical protein